MCCTRMQLSRNKRFVSAILRKDCLHHFICIALLREMSVAVVLKMYAMQKNSMTKIVFDSLEKKTVTFHIDF